MASKTVTSFIGSPTGSSGISGERFNTPRGVAVNELGTGGASPGDVYVVESSNHRVQQFSAAGALVRAFGLDVVRSGPNDTGATEQQSLTVVATGGSFTLSFNNDSISTSSTQSIAFDASPATVKAALESLSNIGGVGGTVTVTGGPGDASGSTPYTIVFGGTLAGDDVGQLTTGATGLTGSPKSATVTTTVNGGGTYEICDTTAGNVAVDCKQGSTAVATGGTLSGPQGIAINQANGHLYVSNGSLLRIDEFDATGHFIRAFGQDVVQTGKPEDNPLSAAKQTLKVEATAGQFTLSLRGQTSADIDFNASAATVQTALQGLPTVGAGNVTVTGGPGDEGGTTPYAITFSGALNNAPMPLISATNGTTPLSGGAANASVSSTTTGSSAYEICTTAANCKSGTSASSAGAFLSPFNGHLAVAPTGAPNAGNVLVADPGNRRVQEFTSAGSFVRAFGFDVTSSPPNAVTAFETCDASNLDVCKVAAASGSGIGQFGSSGPNRLGVDASGAVYTVEQASPNFRVQKFTPAGPALTPSLFNPTISASPAVSLSGASSSDSPTDVAIGPSGNVFVGKTCTEANCPGASPSGERRIYEFSPAGSLLDSHLVSAGIASFNGLAANAANGRLYVSSSLQLVFALADASPPSAAIASADGIGATTATFHGSVNPGGVLADYHFEYVDDASFQATAWANAQILPQISAGNGSSPSAVTRAVEALLPSTLYHVRLVIKQTYGAATATSSAGSFTTGPAGPLVAPFATARTETSSAVLTSRVMPNGQATTYHYEWGPTSAYGNTTQDENAGSGTKSVFTSASLSGLQPESTYHFRLVASNPSGAVESEDHVFRTDAVSPAPPCANAALRQGLGAQLPDCRAFEQVSPQQKNGHDVGHVGIGGIQAAGPIAPNGDAAAFTSYGSYADAQWGGFGTMSYVSRRDSNGWSTKALQPPPLTDVLSGMGVPFLNLDLTESILRTTAPLDSNPAASPNGNFYARDTTTGDLALLTAGGGLSGSSTSAASADASHLVVSSTTSLTSEPGQPSDSIRKVYEIANGQIRLVSRRPGDDVPLQEASEVGGGTTSRANPVSEDGDHIFFTSANAIYRRSNGTTTVLASPTRRVPPDPKTQAKAFTVASADGNRALFVTAEKLTNDANQGQFVSQGDLYNYDFAADRLINLTASTPGTTPASVFGVLGTSSDGDRVYFAAGGQLVDGEGTPGLPNLYLWEDDGTAGGTIRFIATLDPENGNTGGAASTLPNAFDNENWSYDSNRTGEVTSDGSHLLFHSRANLTDYDQAGKAQVYIYDADAELGNGALTCISCGSPDVTATGSSLAGLAGTGGLLGTSRRAISVDGRRSIFTSTDSLLPADTNGRTDAYLWEDGVLHLLSSGTASGDSYAFGLSEDGDDAFFRTPEALLPYDVDTNTDLYTAHVGGGFASQNVVVPPSCSGEECRAAGSQVAAAQAPPTASFSGPGNNSTSPPTKPRCGKGKHRIRAKNGKKRCVRNGRGRGQRAGRNGRAER